MEIDLRELCFNAYKHLTDKADTALSGNGKLFEDVDPFVRNCIGEVLHTRNRVQVHDGIAAGVRICHRILEHRRKAMENAATTNLQNANQS